MKEKLSIQERSIMFKLWGKKQVEAPVQAVAIPEVSQSDALRARIDDAKNELTKIDQISASEEKELETNSESLRVLDLRIAELRGAIAVGELSIAQGGPHAEITKVHVKRAKAELADKESEQKILNDKVDTLRSFLESVNEQRAQLENIILRSDQRLSELEMREMELNINKSITAVDSNIDEYRRHVYVAEAQRELSTGII